MTIANLKSIKDSIINSVSHNPNSASYHSRVIEMINDAQKDVWLSRNWKFNFKTENLESYYDKTPDRFGPGGAVLSINKNSKVAKIRSDVVFTLLPNNTIASDWFGNQVVGPEDAYQYLVIGNFEYQILSIIDSAGNEDVESEEFTIVTGPGETSTITDTQTITYSLVYLDRVYTGENIVNASTDWKIIHRNYFLPRDCVEVLDVTFRDTQYKSGNNFGKIHGINKYIDVERNYPLDIVASRPQIFIHEDDFITDSPRGGNYITSPLHPTISAAAVSASGSTPIPAGSYYFGMSYVYGGADRTDQRLLPESSILWSSLPTAFDGTTKATVSFSNLSTAGTEGLYIKLYIGFANGAGKIIPYELLDESGSIPDGYYASNSLSAYLWPLYLKPINVGTDINGYTYYKWTHPTSISVTGDNISIGDGIGRIGSKIRMVHSSHNSRKVISFYPRVDAYEGDVEDIVSPVSERQRVQFQLRYIYEPQEMLHPNDQLTLPSDFRKYIEHKVISEIFLTILNDNIKANIHEQKAQQLLNTLEARHVSEADTEIIKGNGWRNRGRKYQYRGYITNNTGSN